MTPTRWLHCIRCDVAYRGIHHVDPCWHCTTHDAVKLADGIPDRLRSTWAGQHWSADIQERSAA